MIENSFQHAKKNGLWRKNKVHGEEEVKLVLEETFCKADEKGETSHLESAGDLQELLLTC